MSLSKQKLADMLEVGVVAICHDVRDRVENMARPVWSEQSLREELFSCVLSSQVPDNLVQATILRLRETGLLGEKAWSDVTSHYEHQVLEVLSQPMSVGSSIRRYRFPALRARQIATTRDRFLANSLELLPVVMKSNVQLTRITLIEWVDGLGPKQASMFLRNVGVTYDLAILDRHTILYMDILGLLPRGIRTVTTLRLYEAVENALVRYAKSLGFAIGYLDWAMWIVMQAARRSRYI